MKAGPWHHGAGWVTGMAWAAALVLWPGEEASHAMDTSSGKRNKADRADASRDSCLYLGDFNRQRLSPGMKAAERHFPFGVPGGSGRFWAFRTGDEDN